MGSKDEFVDYEFYVLEKNKEKFLYYYDDYKVNCLSLDTKQKQAADFELHEKQVPFLVFDGKSKAGSGHSVSIYKDNSGKKTNLISKEDYMDIKKGLNLEHNDFEINKNVECLEEWVYYTLEYNVYDETGDLGWRPYFLRGKTWVYRKNLNTGEKELLYSF